VRVLSTAIDERTPYNANHSRNMARYAASFLDWLEQSENDWKFDPDHRREFLMSVWLHDVGKLTVPLEVMDKQSRLGPGLKDVQQRFATMKLLTRIDLLEGRISAEEAETLNAQRAEALALIEKVDKAGFLPDDTLAAIDALAGRTYRDENGKELPWITEEEHVCLSIRKGTLTAAERQIMEDHVVVTGRILDQVSFPEEYSNVPVWAAAHHELLNGKGYPLHRTAESLPPEVRLLTILDVFDALTAKDRPYKPGMPVEKALSILHSMVNEGSMDENILALFEQSRAWEEHV
jgi:HD-GYP domain-containing protein (c-di-GMP phosphodiesterase class II)